MADLTWFVTYLLISIVPLQPIVHAVEDPFYKITSEALLVTQQLVKVIRPLGNLIHTSYFS